LRIKIFRFDNKYFLHRSSQIRDIYQKMLKNKFYSKIRGNIFKIVSRKLLVIQEWIKNDFVKNSIILNFHKKDFVHKGSQIQDIYKKSMKNCFFFKMIKNTTFLKIFYHESIDRMKKKMKLFIISALGFQHNFNI